MEKSCLQLVGDVKQIAWLESFSEHFIVSHVTEFSFCCFPPRVQADITQTSGRERHLAPQTDTSLASFRTSCESPDTSVRLGSSSDRSQNKSPGLLSVFLRVKKKKKKQRLKCVSCLHDLFLKLLNMTVLHAEWNNTLRFSSYCSGSDCSVRGFSMTGREVVMIMYSAFIFCFVFVSYRRSRRQDIMHGNPLTQCRGFNLKGNWSCANQKCENVPVSYKHKNNFHPT